MARKRRTEEATAVDPKANPRRCRMCGLVTRWENPIHDYREWRDPDNGVRYEQPYHRPATVQEQPATGIERSRPRGDE